MNRWVGKVALVTGASSGIGAAIVIELVKHGLQVVAVARRKDKIEELKKHVVGAKGTLHPLECDVSKESEITKTFQWIKSNLKSIHVLVNNAGFVRFGRLVDDNPEEWRKMFDVNVLGLCICTQQAVKLMRDTGVNDGHIVNINSVAGHPEGHLLPVPELNVYPATKHAVTALTETLRQELLYMKTRIKVTGISPGYVETGFISVGNSGDVKGTGITEFTKTMEGLKPKDIADTVVFALSTAPHVQIHEIIMRPIEQPL